MARTHAMSMGRSTGRCERNSSKSNKPNPQTTIHLDTNNTILLVPRVLEPTLLPREMTKGLSCPEDPVHGHLHHITPTILPAYLATLSDRLRGDPYINLLACLMILSTLMLDLQLIRPISKQPRRIQCTHRIRVRQCKPILKLIIRHSLGIQVTSCTPARRRMLIRLLTRLIPLTKPKSDIRVKQITLTTRHTICIRPSISIPIHKCIQLSISMPIHKCIRITCRHIQLTRLFQSWQANPSQPSPSPGLQGNLNPRPHRRSLSGFRTWDNSEALFAPDHHR